MWCNIDECKFINNNVFNFIMMMKFNEVNFNLDHVLESNYE